MNWCLNRIIQLKSIFFALFVYHERLLMNCFSEPGLAVVRLHRSSLNRLALMVFVVVEYLEPTDHNLTSPTYLYIVSATIHCYTRNELFEIFMNSGRIKNSDIRKGQKIHSVLLIWLQAISAPKPFIHLLCHAIYLILNLRHLYIHIPIYTFWHIMICITTYGMTDDSTQYDKIIRRPWPIIISTYLPIMCKTNGGQMNISVHIRSLSEIDVFWWATMATR